MSVVEQLLKTIAKISDRQRDDAYNAALLVNPEAFATGLVDGVVRKQVPATGAGVTSAVLPLFKNTTNKPVMLFIRAVTNDSTDFNLMFGTGRDDEISFTSAPGLEQGASLKFGVLVPVNGTLKVSLISATGLVAITAVPLQLRGRRIVFGDCEAD